jgi:small subunit ribosomal protein S16
MVRIRLRRVGAKRQPSYRIVAADKESPRDGRFLEILGFYNPRTEPATIQLKEDRIYQWLDNGAQPSDSAEQVLKSAGFFDRYSRYKKGESLEELLEEAKAAEEKRNIDPRTRRDDLMTKK